MTIAAPQDHSLLVFRLDDRRYALDVAIVQRALPMMDIAPLPDAPGIVAGVIDVAGRIVPMMNLRRRFGLEERAPRLSDVLIVAMTRTLTVALPADGIDGVVLQSASAIVRADAIAPGLEHVAGVARLHDGLAMIQDLDAFLSLPERTRLDEALAALEQAG